MNKQKEILELEKVYGITLSESKPDERNRLERNSYAVDKNGKITHLNLSGNQLTEIKGLEKFVDLRSLDLSENQLTEIKGLETLVKLQELNLLKNQLKRIVPLETSENDSGYNDVRIEVNGADMLAKLPNLYLWSV
jgi:Leucine-rich repeat (LRR) protein